MTIIDSGIKKLRDPFVLVEDGVMYAYGTGWVCHRNTTGKLDSGWEDAKVVVELPEGHDFSGDLITSDIHKGDGSYMNRRDGQPWAPEVHKYNGAYYMFTTYNSSKTGHRGSVIFKADNPMGPFRVHSDGHITSSEYDCIDATLYIDEEGKPWMVFVHEWTCTDDGIGRFDVARLSDDLTHLITEPKELFRADSFPWTNLNVTDGCFLYKTEKGSLLMLWSNFIPDGGYAVGVARSKNGKVDGEWTDDGVLYSLEKSGRYDGGHGMIFEFQGQKYLSIHSPNAPVGDREEMPVFIPVCEENDKLCLC